MNLIHMMEYIIIQQMKLMDQQQEIVKKVKRKYMNGIFKI